MYTDLCRYTRQKPVVVLIGPERTTYSVHRSLFAAKSPFFRTLLKDCWDGKKEEIEIGNISSAGFDIAVDWIYSGRLPDRVKEYSKDGSQPWDSTLCAYKVADVLMINKLQNEIIANEAAIFSKHGLKWRFCRLKDIYDNDLCHTKYYSFVLKSVVANMMTNQNQSSENWDDDLTSIEGDPQILSDLLRSVREWTRKPWKDFPKGDLTAFFVQDEHDQRLTS